MQPEPSKIDNVAPNDLDSEKAVLGSILIDQDAIKEISEVLRPDDFYRQAHAIVYAAMLRLSARHEPVDVVTVAAVLQETGDLELVGGASFLSALGNVTPTAVHGAQYARTVADRSRERATILAAGRIAQLAYDHDSDLAERVSEIVSAIPRVNSGADPFSRLGARLLSDISITPAAPPLRGRLDPTGATVVYGTGGVGKGTLAASWGAGLIEDGHRILLLDYEDHPNEWAPRVDALGGIDARKSVLYVSPSGPFWRGTRGPLWSQARELRDLVDKHGATFVVVDSIVAACAGTDPLRPEAASLYFGGLNAIGLPSLSLAHTTKATDLVYPFGSVYFHNFARVTWSLERKHANLLLVNRKANGYAHLGRFVVSPLWSNGSLQSVFERPYMATLADRIADVLVEGPLTVSEITARLSEEDDDDGVKPGSVRTTLDRGAKHDPPRFEETGGRWQVAR